MAQRLAALLLRPVRSSSNLIVSPSSPSSSSTATIPTAPVDEAFFLGDGTAPSDFQVSPVSHLCSCFLGFVDDRINLPTPLRLSSPPTCPPACATSSTSSSPAIPSSLSGSPPTFSTQPLAPRHPQPPRPDRRRAKQSLVEPSSRFCSESTSSSAPDLIWRRRTSTHLSSFRRCSSASS